MRSASVVLAVLAGSVAAATAPVDDPNYLLTAPVAPTLPLVGAPPLSITTTPTIVPVVDTRAATSAPSITQLPAYAGSSTFAGITSQLPAVVTAKSVLESLSSASLVPSSYPALPTSAPVVPTNATGDGPPTTALKVFPGPIETKLPDINTAHTLLSSLIPSLSLVSPTPVTSPRPSLPPGIIPAPAPAPVPAPGYSPPDDCKKGKTTLVTSVRPGTGYPPIGTAPAYPTRPVPTGHGGHKGDKPKWKGPPYKQPPPPNYGGSPEPNQQEKEAYYNYVLAKIKKWAAEHGYN